QGPTRQRELARTIPSDVASVVLPRKARPCQAGELFVRCVCRERPRGLGGGCRFGGCRILAVVVEMTVGCEHLATARRDAFGCAPADSRLRGSGTVNGAHATGKCHRLRP